jgi:hypothetical protein
MGTDSVWEAAKLEHLRAKTRLIEAQIARASLIGYYEGTPGFVGAETEFGAAVSRADPHEVAAMSVARFVCETGARDVNLTYEVGGQGFSVTLYAAGSIAREMPAGGA